MIWRENAAQQQQQHDLQQQQQPQQQQPKRLSFSFNVKIAVNVNTKMSTTHINPNSLKCCSQSSSRSSSSSRSRSRTPTRSTTTKHLVGWRQQLSHLGRQFANGYNNWQWPGQSQGHHHHHQQGSGISTILIVNLLLLLLLSLCCDVCCRSHAEQLQQQPHQPQQPHQLNYSSSPAAMPPLRIQENMRPTLDSDVVEKVAVWNKHVGAVAEGIAISSVARSRPFYAPDTPHYPHHEHQQQQQQQQQHDLGLEVETAIDERIAIEQVTRDCVQRCIVEEDLFLDEFGIKCAKADNSDKCYKTRCTNGCAQWYRALKEIEPCQEACVSTQFYPFDMPCIGACEMAQRQYWHLQRLAMTQLVETTQPQLVEMTGESATLTIRWDMQFPENYLASRPFNIQYQQQNEEQESPWHNMADYNCDEYYVCEIAEALMPYTRYKFRFELPFGESSEDVLYSPTTPIYQTPMAGAPISAPIITTLLSLDEEHVGVHWRPGRYTNAPLQGYHIRLRSDASNASSSNREELLPASRSSFIFGELHPLTNYTVELTMINKQGKGPPAMASIQTKAPLSPEQLRSVLLTSERNISWQSLEPAGESRVIFSAEADATINDMVYSERQQQLWVLDSLGRLYRQQLEEANSRQLLQLQLNSSEWRPRRLSLDWLQHRLYLAVEDPTQQHQLFSCSQDGDDVQQLVKTALGTKVQQLELDAVNGWLFWSDAQAIWRLDLHSKQRLQLHQAQQLGHFVLLPHRWLLQLLQQEDQLLELSYDGSHKRQLEQLPSAQLAATFALSSDKRQLLVANATQLQLLERHTLNVIASWPLSAEQELLVQLTPLERRRQPLALEATTPRELRALLGAQAAQISWQEPALNPYQAVSSNCSYELEVLDVASQSAYNIRNIRSPHFGLERLQPDNLYQLRVRAINAASQAGEWTSALLSRTWPRGEHRLRWATQRGDLYVTNELGAQLEMLPARLEPMSPGPLSLLNASIAYYVSNGTLRCINLLQPQLSCQAPPQTQHVGAVAYDWRGGLLYWTDLERDCVQRLDPQSGSRELLPIFGARHLALDPEQGHLYYASTAHLARRPMSAQDTQQPELEYYHVSGLAGQINGFSLDLQQRYIYWLVGGSSVQAELHLYRSSLSLASGSQPPEMIQLPPGASAVPHTLQFLQPLNALLWLQGKQASSAQLLRMSEQLESEHLRPQELSEPLSAVQLLASSALSAPDSGVRPLAVPPDSIRIDEGGHWDDFRLRWQPAASGGNHSICYKLLLEHGSERVLTLELATPFARITQLSHAPQQLRVSITPHTSWRAGPTSSVQLSTPVAAPTQPRRLRVFVERQAVPLQLEPNVSALLRWDVPEEEHGLGSQALQYRISCWQGSELHTELLLNQSTLEARIEQLQPDVTYRFQVQAHVAATGVAAGATSHALHVAPEVQSVPRLLYANAEHIGELDLDTATRRQLVHTASPVEHLALMQGEQRLLWVNEHVELLSHVPGSAPAKLARMRAEVLALTVDWVQRIVYWAELDASTQPPAACIYRLDLCRFEGRILQGERMWSTPPGQLLHDLVALPHARSLVWLQHELGARNATLEGRSLANGSALSFESVPGPLWRLFEGSQEPQSETLNLVDHQGRLCVYHVARQLCMPTALRSQLNLLSDDIAQLAQDAGYIYALRNGSVRGYSRRRQQLAYVLDLQPDEVRLLRAYNYQAYPSRRCLLLPTLGVIEAPMCEETHCQLQLTALTAASDCPLPVPGLEYQLQLSSAHAQLRQLHALAGEQLNITGLQPYRAYELRVRISSYYQQRLGLEALQLAPLELQTAAATPSAPRNFTGRALSPSELELSWAAPLELRSDSVYYVLHWLLEDQPLEQALEQPLVQEQRVETAGTQRLTGLQPGRVYQVWVQAHATPGKFNRSESLFLRCYAPLPPLQLEELHAYGMTLSWFGTPDVLSTLALECQSLREQLHLNVLGNHTTMRLESLQPKTRYSCRLALNYAASPGAPVYYGASQDYETLGDAPSAPGRPQIEHIAGEIFRVSWTPAEEHGDPILLYNMEALQARRGSRRRRRRDTAAQLLPWAEEPTVLEDQWLDFCNTTELSCLVRDLYSRRLFLFRVRARNRPHGWGPYSEESDRIAEPFVSPEKRGSLVLAIIAPAAIVSSCVLALILVRKVQKRRHRAKKLLQQSRPSIWSNLSALQTQQQLLAARNRTFSMTLSDADIALLPQISWNRLTLLRFLGSGAFGEVYEGQLQGEDEAQPQRVAIKSLRKGASEFAELLQEAQLMSNFKHENIVCLIGICFDSESISLIMEHMEAGDLLSYLRAARPNSQEQLPGQTETQSTTTTPTPTSQLQLPDLLAMCLDVANGCSYLEDMHFVHRDLACRNCLVSNGAAVGGRRIVKIGDFGLARDIYKSDYYRKEGEGLLPVRWMALESLVDGIFSTQSDVWAFGVLCWEILTLGQQPYAARNNFEVLAHVKDGGRLQPPDECPEKLYALLLQCWRCEPWERPSFRRCYNTLQSINSELHSPSSNVSVPKPEARVHFDETTEHQSTKENTTPANSVSSSTKKTVADNRQQQLYANEGVSRL
ncbi:protein sevenless [Drosophila albomicans]|uniref:Protein sevenless n=1 Tax=Drosophila albomicans TaxID=7291 RepID=A0A9C6T3H5_DROAB|nr:protein sevenless [Drosophila albomicans]